MRLWNVLATFPALAVGMALWKHSLWVVGPENEGADGTCAGLEESLSQLLAIVSFILAGLILFRFNLLCRLVRRFTEIVDLHTAPGECEPRPPKDAGEMFY